MKRNISVFFLTLLSLNPIKSFAQSGEDSLRRKTESTVCDEIKKNSKSSGTCSISEWGFLTYTVTFNMTGNVTEKAGQMMTGPQKNWLSINRSWAYTGTITCDLSQASGWSCAPRVDPFPVSVQSKPCFCSTGDIVSPFARCMGPAYCQAETTSEENGLTFINFSTIADGIPKATDSFLSIRPR